MLYVCEIQHSTHIFLDEGIDFKKLRFDFSLPDYKKGNRPQTVAIPFL